MWRGSPRVRQDSARSRKTMAEIVNLRRARKAKSRREKETAAEANRAKHGVAKRERELVKAREEKGKRDIEAHKLSDDE
jgi:hypothetical protein